MDILSQGKSKQRLVKLLGTIKLLNQSIDGIRIEKLSGLAWDEDSQRLLAISDHGYLFHFKVVLKAGRLDQVTPVAVFPLLDEQGKAIIGSQLSDAEGLVLSNADNGIIGDTRLWVSFEQKMRVVRYTSQGRWLAKVTLPKILASSSNYDKYNSGLEALLLHPQYGLLVAPEYKLKNEADDKRVIYATHHGKVKAWQFRSLSGIDSGLVAMEAMPSGRVLLLERSWAFPFTRIIIGLRVVDLNEWHSYEPLAVTNLLIMDTKKGWSLDNYEGLTRIKSDQYMMVSDDNGLPFQSTLFTLFSLP